MGEVDISDFLMVDLETLNTSVSEPNIMQIGCCRAKKVFREWAFTSTSRACRFSTWNLDPGTLKWWTTQPLFADILRKSIESELDPIEAFDECLDELFKGVKTDVLMKTYIVANPPSFDLAMLRSVYGESMAMFPFHWSKELDFRTAKNLLADFRESEETAMGNEGLDSMRHDAEYDAILQARAFARMLELLS